MKTGPCCLSFTGYSKLSRGLLRVRRAADQDTLNELFWTFGQTVASKQALQKFGLNIKGSASCVTDFLPRSYVAHSDKARLDANLKIILEQLAVTGTRDYFIALDETTWRSTYEALSGYIQGGQQLLVGGQYSEDPEQDWSWLLDSSSLPEEKLAKLSIHWVLGRSDSSSQVWEVSMLPLPQESAGKAAQLMKWTGQLLERACRANNDLAPLGVASDGGSANLALRNAFLGLMGEELQDYPFFDQCEVAEMGLPRVPCGRLTFQGQPLFFSLDVLHVLKRFSAHHCAASRIVEWGDSWVEIAIGLSHPTAPLPVKSYVQKDSQSDRESFQRLNPAHYPTSWAGFGVAFMLFMSALLSSAWEGSRDLTAEQRFLNAGLCYHILLLNRMRAAQTHGSSWSSHFIPQMTCRNVAHCCILAMQLAIWLPPKSSCEPRNFAEKIAEHHFSRVKSDSSGSPSLAFGVRGCCKLHMQLYRQQLHIPEPTSSRISHKRAVQLMEVCFRDALALQSWICVGQSEEKLEKDFNTWFKRSGKQLLTSKKIAQEDMLDELEGDNVEIENEAEEDLSEDLAALTAAGDQVAQRLALQQLSEAIAAGEPLQQAPGTPTTAPPEQSAAVVPENAEDNDWLQELQGSNTFHELIQACRD